MWRSRLSVRVGLFLMALSVLAATAAAFGPKPKLDLIVRSVRYVQDQNVVLEVVYRAGDLRSTGMQFDIEYSDKSSVTVASGPAAEFAHKNLAVVDLDRNHKRVLAFGLNADLIWDGVLVVITVAPGEAGPQDQPPIRLTSVLAVDQDAASVAMDPVEYKAPATAFEMRRMLAAQPFGYSLPLLPVYATMACTSDVNGDGRVDVADLQLLASMLAGDTPAGRCDLDGDGKLTIADFQVVLNEIVRLASASRAPDLGLKSGR